MEKIKTLSPKVLGLENGKSPGKMTSLVRTEKLHRIKVNKSKKENWKLESNFYGGKTIINFETLFRLDHTAALSRGYFPCP